MAQTVTVDSAGSAMKIYDAAPDGAARGAVIVIQEAFGVNDHIEDLCRRLASEGYCGIAPHLFHRSGDAVIAYDDMANVMPHMQALTREGFDADLDATLDHVHGLGFRDAQIGVIGFCMGGSVTVLAAAEHALGGAVTFYGGGIAAGRLGIPPLLELAPQLETPWLGLFGDRDQGIPIDQVEALRDAAKQASVDTDVVRYAEAEHGFHCDARGSYHEASAKDAWQRMLGWLDGHLAKS
jgi:carboxymethylenebutenolidase